MAQLQTIDSGVEVNGQTVLAFIDGVPSTFEDKAEKLLAENGIKTPSADEWYSQQAWLDAFAEMADEIGQSTLKNVGKSIPKTAEWPPGIDGVAEGIESIDEAYHRNHRGGEIGHYHVETVDDKTVRVRCTNPYPCAFDHGIIEAVAKEFADGYPRVDEVGTTCRSDDGNECVYEVTW